MARKRNSPETIGEILARLMDVKRRMIEAGIASGDLEPARNVIDGGRIFVRYLREDLENQLRNGTLEDMTPEQAQQAHLQHPSRPSAHSAELPRCLRRSQLTFGKGQDAVVGACSPAVFDANRIVAIAG
jgi:hypothetical protein